jgi:hypothetical protein
VEYPNWFPNFLFLSAFFPLPPEALEGGGLYAEQKILTGGIKLSSLKL